MLPKNRRVKREDFDLIVKSGGWCHATHFTLRVVPSPLQTQSQFAVSVSKKIAKHAVDRNLVKRRIYAVLEKVILKIRPNLKGAFFAKKGVLGMSFSELEKEVLETLQKAKVMVS